MNHYSGAYSCEDKGDNTLGSTPLQRVWPYSSSNVVRSNVYTEQQIQEKQLESWFDIHGSDIRFEVSCLSLILMYM